MKIGMMRGTDRTDAQEAFQLIDGWITRSPGSGSGLGLLMLIGSLYAGAGSRCRWSVPQIIHNFDEKRRTWALKVIEDYTWHGESDELLALGEKFGDEIEELDAQYAK